jgi:peptide/nickel transport system substrate-binding protein
MNKNGLSRRDFLKTMAAAAAAAVSARAVPMASAAPLKQGAYKEAPMLAELVASGALPPVEERLPADPRVITPYEEVGEFGGTWRRAFKGISDRWGPVKLNEEMAIEWDAPDPDTTNLVPNYISEWSQNDDATEFTFTFREGLKWSDGVPVTTEDVQFWYDEFFLTSLFNKPDFYIIGGVDMQLELIDALTWKVTFAVPNPLLPIRIAKSTGGSTGGPTMAAPKHYLYKYFPHLTDDQGVIDAAMETYGVATWEELHFETARGDARGPISFWFKNPDLPVINAWAAGNSPLEDPYLMVRNPYYHAVDTEGNQLPYIDKISHALFQDTQTLNLWVAQGQIDMQQRHLSTADYTFFKENEETGDYHVVLWKAALTHAFHPNVSTPNNPVLRQLFDTAEFREALSIAINREEINDLIYNGMLEPRQASPVSGSPEYDSEFETRWTEYNLDRANELLDGLGLTERDSNGYRLGPDGNTITFAITWTDVLGMVSPDEIQLVVGYWRAIGLRVSQEVLERSLYNLRCDAGEVEVGVWFVDRSSVVMADPGRYLGTVNDGPWAPLYAHWLAAQLSPNPAEYQYANEEPPPDHPIREIRALWEKVQVEPDEATRNGLFKQLLDIHKAHPYMIGTVGEDPQPVIVKNNFFNVGSGFISDDTLRNVGLLRPVQFFMRES